MVKIAIIGYGHVGKGVQKIFPDAILYDPMLYYAPNKELINACDLAIICVPTPPLGMKEQAVPDSASEFLDVDISIVEETVAWLKTPLILIKSTVPPYTTDYLKTKYGKRICFSPEYMGEGGYYIPPQHPDPTDPRQHSWMIVGGEKHDCDEIINLFMPRLGPSKTYYTCSAVEAELIKYMENSWIATKVTFANEWKNICDTFHVSYHTVREGWALDSRVEKMHTAVFPEKRGFGGKCLPKDLHGIISACKREGYDADLLKQVWKVNQKMIGVKNEIFSK